MVGKTIRLDAGSATIVGVLEPSVPYPAETEIIANVVTSPHHLSATMVTGRVRTSGSRRRGSETSSRRAQDRAAGAARRVGARLRRGGVLERRQPDPDADDAARSVLAIRAALGAGTSALRLTLLAESLLLCGAGALLGVLSARPMVAILT